MEKQDYIQLAQYICRNIGPTGVGEAPFSMFKLLTLIELDHNISKGLLDLFEEQLAIRFQILNTAFNDKEYLKIKILKKQIKNIFRFRLKLQNKISKNDSIYADSTMARSYLPIVTIPFEKYELNKGRLSDSLAPYLSRVNRPYITKSMYETLTDLNDAATCVPSYFQMAKELFGNKELIILSYEEAYDCFFAYSDNIELFHKVYESDASNQIMNDNEMIGISTDDKQKFLDNVFKHFDVIYDFKNFELFHKGHLEFSAEVRNKPLYDFANKFSNITKLKTSKVINTDEIIETIASTIKYEKELIDLNVHQNNKVSCFNKTKELSTVVDVVMFVMLTYALPDFIIFDVKTGKVTLSIHSHNALGELAVSLFEKSFLALDLNNSDIIHTFS